MDKQKLTDEELDQVTGGSRHEYDRIIMATSWNDMTRKDFNNKMINLLSKMYNVPEDKISFDIGSRNNATFSVPGYQLKFMDIVHKIAEYKKDHEI